MDGDVYLNEAAVTLCTKVLVVDDVRGVLGAFADALQRVPGAQVDVTLESDGDAAVARARREAFDVVIADYRLESATGIRVLQAARQRHARGLRILMTGYDEIPEVFAAVRDADVDAYLRKPVPARDLLLFLHDVVNREPDALAALREEARAIEQAAASE